MFFANLKIGVKMGLVFGFLLLMIIVLIFLGLSSTREVNVALENIANDDYAKTVHAFHAAKSLDDLQASIRMRSYS